MATPPLRETVDLSEHPDLVVIYLGMRVASPRGLLKLVRTGMEIDRGSPLARPGSCCTSA